MRRLVAALVVVALAGCSPAAPTIAGPTATKFTLAGMDAGPHLEG